MANRNGFYYVLDRQNGEFLTAAPYVKQTWADGLDAKGRPYARHEADPRVDGTLVYPFIADAANWYSPSYSPKTRLFYQAARELGGVYFKGDAEYKGGTAYTGGGGEGKNDDAAYGAVRALEATSGKLRWEFKLLHRLWRVSSQPQGGLFLAARRRVTFSRSMPKRVSPSGICNLAPRFEQTRCHFPSTGTAGRYCSRVIAVRLRASIIQHFCKQLGASWKEVKRELLRIF